MAEVMIGLNGVKKSYGKHEVLRNITMDVYKGDIFGLIGKNGSGKTTLFKVILGLTEYQGGKICIGNDPKDPMAGRKHTGFFIGTNFFGYMNARQNLEYYREMKNIKDPSEVDRVLKIVGLDQAKGKVKGFSLGMKQRLGIANAILGNPELLILDEPTNGLDPQGIADIRMLIQRLNEEYGMTVIVSSHILGELQHTAHRFGIINEGTVARVITQEDLQIRDRFIRLEVDDAQRAKEVLAAAGIQIRGEAHETRSLEDYYFELLGGGNK